MAQLFKYTTWETLLLLQLLVANETKKKGISACKEVDEEPRLEEDMTEGTVADFLQVLCARKLLKKNTNSVLIRVWRQNHSLYILYCY